MKILFYVFGFPVYYFGVMIAAGMLAGILISYNEVKRKKLEYCTILINTNGSISENAYIDRIIWIYCYFLHTTKYEKYIISS
jgi:hypothetical protein